MVRHGTSRGMINFLNSAGNGVGHIHGTGSTVTYNSVSDYRLKENVVAISDGITRLKLLSRQDLTLLLMLKQKARWFST